MPKLYQFPAIKCSENENFRSSSLAGCRYEPKVPDFTPHSKGPKGTIKPQTLTPQPQIPSQFKPKPQPIPTPTSTPTPAPILTQTPFVNKPEKGLDETNMQNQMQNLLDQHGIGHLLPKPSIQYNKNNIATTPVNVEMDLKNRLIATVTAADNEHGKNLSYTEYEALSPEAKSEYERHFQEYVKQAHEAGALNNNVPQNYEIDYKNVTKDYMVFHDPNLNETSIVFRGQNGARPRGADQQHIKDTLLGKSKDYGYLDALYKDAVKTYPGSEIKILSYSNGGPKGLYLSNKYNLEHYSIDPVLGPNEAKILRSNNAANAKLEIVRTPNPALASGGAKMLNEIITGTEEVPYKLTYVDPLTTQSGTSSISDLSIQHSSNISASDALRTNYKNPSQMKQFGTGLGVGLAAGFGANAVTEAVMPKAPEQAKIATNAAVGAGLTQVISPVVGAGAVSASELFLPLYASIQATEATQKIIQNLPGFRNDPTGMSTAAIAGGIGGTVFAGTGMAQSAAISALSGAATTTTAATTGIELAGVTEVGVEMAEVGLAEVGEIALAGEAGVEMAGLGTAATIEAGLVTATEVTGTAAATEGGLNPIADGLFIAAGTGAILTAGITGISRLFHHEDKGQSRDFYVLKPHTDHVPDSMIGRDPKIVAIMNGFNAKQDYSGTELHRVKHKIDERVHEMIRNGNMVEYYYQPEIVKTTINDRVNIDENFIPFDDNHGYMPPADYSKIYEQQRQTNERHKLENKVVQSLAQGQPVTLTSDQEELLTTNEKFWKAYTNFQVQTNQIDVQDIHSSNPLLDAAQMISDTQEANNVWQDNPHPQTAHTFYRPPVTQTNAPIQNSSTLRDPFRDRTPLADSAIFGPGD